MEDAKETHGSWGWSQLSVAGIITLILLSFTFLAWRKASRKQRLPPGPRRWPVVGSLLSLGAPTLPYQAFDNLSKQYGPIMFMYFGKMPFLIVSNSQVAEAIFKTNDQIMASRPRSIMAQKFSYNYQDIAVAAYGPTWRYLRKLSTQEIFTTHRLNQFQNLRQREIMEMLHSILEKAEQGKDMIIRESVFDMTINMMTQMMFNKSYFSAKHISKEAMMFRAIFKEMLFLMGKPNIADFIPILKHFDVQGYQRRADAAQERFDTFIESVLKERRKDSSAGSEANFADVLLTLSDQSEGSLNSEERLSMDSVKAILSNMIVAGTETSSTTLEWALAELVKHPGMLQKAQEEIDLVVGKSRLVEEEDLPKLKYIQALVKETLRFHAPLQLLPPRASMKDCEIEGYHIPAGTGVLINAWTIHRDPQVWEKPHEFNPERFMGSLSIMDVKGKCFDLLPFGSGRRICPGMNLGLLMVQYPLAQMLQVFNWSVPADQTPEELDMSESFGLVYPIAIPLRVQAQLRLPKHIICPTNPM